MTDRFPRAFALLAVHEGGYSNHPSDPGGATMRGVTQRTYDAHRRRQGQATRDVRSITDAEVEAIYRTQYWDAVRADELPAGLAYCVFDAAVNSGPSRAAKWLQRIVGVAQDGVVGSQTIAAAQAMSAVEIINRYCDMRLAFMKRLKHWSAFKNGWTRRVAEVRAQSINWAQDQAVPDSRETSTAKARGDISTGAAVKDFLSDRGAIGSATGLLGSTGALVSGDGPIQYGIAAALVIGALGAIWWLVRGRDK